MTKWTEEELEEVAQKTLRLIRLVRPGDTRTDDVILSKLREGMCIPHPPNTTST